MDDPVVTRLRAAGCVYAEEEAALLRDDDPDARTLRRRVARRCAGEPLEQVLGWVDLGALRLRVAPGCFVPRQRTLLLVDRALAEARARVRPVVVEAYAGVAPVAGHVAHAVPDADVHACELDPAAARAAAVNLGAGGSVHVGDGLDALPAVLRARVDVVAAVAPYVPDGAWDLLPHEARDHEPAAALLGGADGLDHVRRLLGDAVGWLAPDGVVLVEVGADQAEAAVAAATGHGHRASCVTDDEARTAVVRAVRAPPDRAG